MGRKESNQTKQNLPYNLSDIGRQPSGVFGQASTSSLYSSISALHTSLTTSEMVLWGTLQLNFIEAYLFPEARLRKVRSSFRPGSRGSLYRICILVILGPTQSSSSSNMSGGMRSKVGNDAGSSLRSSIKADRSELPSPSNP